MDARPMKLQAIKSIFGVASCLLIFYLLVGGTAGSRNPPATNVCAPGAPSALVANVEDGAISLGWKAPARNGDAPLQNYTVQISPPVGRTGVVSVGTAAVIRGLVNGTTYTFSVTAKNSAGQGPASTSVQATPSPVNPNTYTQMSVLGDDSASGIFDPAVLNASSGKAWLAYGSVNYYDNASTQRVQDVSVRLAESRDGGKIFRYLQIIGPAQPATITDPAGSELCGQPTCAGRWVYEVPWIIEDGADPDITRRYKLFAHKYFLYPPARTGSTQYALGAIVMWTASAPEMTWSRETTVLRWNLTPPEITGGQSTSSVNPELASTLFLSEGGASVYGSALDFVFSCFYPDTAHSMSSKIVLLRTTDHAKSFQYVSTPLTRSDTNALGKEFYTAASLLPSPGSAPVLIASTWKKGLNEGCYVYPLADEQTGILFRQSGFPLSILDLPHRPDGLGGGCAWDRGLTSSGLLMDEVNLTKTRNGYAPPFKILATGRSF